MHFVHNLPKLGVAREGVLGWMFGWEDGCHEGYSAYYGVLWQKKVHNILLDGTNRLFSPWGCASSIGILIKNNLFLSGEFSFIDGGSQRQGVAAVRLSYQRITEVKGCSKTSSQEFSSHHWATPFLRDTSDEASLHSIDISKFVVVVLS